MLLMGSSIGCIVTGCHPGHPVRSSNLSRTQQQQVSMGGQEKSAWHAVPEL